MCKGSRGGGAIEVRARGLRTLDFLSIFIMLKRKAGGAGQGWAGPGRASFAANHLEYFDIQFKSIKWLFAYQFCVIFLSSRPSPCLLPRLLTNCRIALLLFMATNNFGLESGCRHSESLMHGIRDSRVFCVIAASLGPREAGGKGNGC